MGVDVGGEQAATAVVWISEKLHVGCWIGHGDPAVLEAVELVRELAGKYQVVELVYDPWRFGQAAQELSSERLLVVTFPQNDTHMIPASERLSRAIVERRLVVPDDAELRQHVTAAIARHSRRGWRIDRSPEATTSTPSSPYAWRSTASRTSPSPSSSSAGSRNELVSA